MSGQSNDPPEGVDQDRILVDRCLVGDPAAWHDLYVNCHSGLLNAIGSLMEPQRIDINLAEEIAARVWYAVVNDGGKVLSQFDVGRGCRLKTFLAAIARNEVKQYFRSERRRRNREQIAITFSPQNAYAPQGELPSSDLADFLEDLTPKEKSFCEGHLLSRSSQTQASLSPQYRWQLRHRVLMKLRKFLKQTQVDVMPHLEVVSGDDESCPRPEAKE